MFFTWCARLSYSAEVFDKVFLGHSNTVVSYWQYIFLFVHLYLFVSYCRSAITWLSRSGNVNKSELSDKLCYIHLICRKTPIEQTLTCISSSASFPSLSRVLSMRDKNRILSSACHQNISNQATGIELIMQLHNGVTNGTEIIFRTPPCCSKLV